MPDLWMDVDIAIATAPVNIFPLIDDTDFKAIEAAVVYNQAGLALFWNFTTTAGVTTVTAVTPTTSGVYDWTDFTTSGMYGIEIPASGGASANNDAEGIGHFTGVATGILPWRGPTIGFRAAALNNALIDGGDILDVNLTQYLGVAVTGTLITAAEVGQVYKSAITTVTSQTEFVMTTAFSVDDSWIGCEVILQDDSTGLFFPGNNGKTTSIWISDVLQATNTIKINTAFPVTVTTSDLLLLRDRQHPMYALTTFDTATEAAATTNTNSILAKVLAYFRLIARKDIGPTTDDAAELSAINADDGAGAGSYAAGDSLEASQDDLTTVDTVVDTVKAETALIVADTNELQGDDVPGLIATLDSVVDTVKVDTAAILVDTAELQGDDVPGLIAALNDLSDAEVLTQVNAALDTAIAELGVAAPTATPTMRTGLMLMYMALRNLRDTTATTDIITNDAGTTITSATVSDDAVTFRKTEYS